jgi:peptidoglycan/LPS O-acetylase OafA/YrhL
MTEDERRDRAMSLPRLGHVAALDGIRGIAVAIVVLHHLKVPGIHAGWLGVDLFFALSGFLITQSILGMGEGTGLGAFWRRRAWRLGPAMSVLLVAWVLWWRPIDDATATAGLRWRWLGASAGQFLNVHDAWSANGPFSDFLGHLWSLSAEVQFYVVWPIVLVLLLRSRAPRLVVGAVPLALLVGTSIERAVLAAHDVQWNRLYLGADTRSTALWAGCLVGLLHFWGAFDRARWLRIAAAVLSVPAAIVLGWVVSLPSMNFSLSRTPYRWGLTVACACALVLVAAGASSRGGLLRPVLEAPPLEWLGRISYSVYLWHVPLVAVLVHAVPDVTTAGKVAVIVPGALAAGWLSYVLVERPLLSAAGRARLRTFFRGAPTPVG